MKKNILFLIGWALIFSLFSSSASGSVSPDTLVGTGFNSIKWGTHYTKIPKLYDKQLNPNGTISYRIKADKKSFFNVGIKAIYYYFDKNGKFSSAKIYAEGKNSELLAEAFFKKFGKSEEIEKQPWYSGEPSEDCGYLIWNGRNANIIVQHYIFGNQFVNVFITKNGNPIGDW